MLVFLVHQAATDMFVMLLDVHKWVAMPAVAARVRQAGSSAANPSKGAFVCTSTLPLHATLKGILIYVTTPEMRL